MRPLLFPTATFAVFFTFVFGAAWALRGWADSRKAFLLAASYLFYGWWDWRFCFLLAFASLVAWAAGLALGSDGQKHRHRLILWACVGMLLVILGFFKYCGFFLESLQDLLFAFGLQRDLPLLEIILPVGISFFTFQAISYIVDVHRGEIKARRSPLDVMVYISFFPQLVAGPIVRAADFLPQLERKPQLTRAMVGFGLTLCALGLFKKMVVANYLAVDLVDPVFLDPTAFSSVVVLLGVYGYAVQIYCDFSGYSDIAIGTAALLGYRFKENFNQPYRAESLQDFWRRWHMSLSQWLRDYLYIPLGGSRLGTWKTYRNLLATMVLGGLWHGAAWNFVIWGMIHGGWLALERVLVGNQAHAAGRLRRLVGWFVTFHVVCAAWVFFRATDMLIVSDWYSVLFSGTAGLEGLTWLCLILIVGTLAMQFSPPRLETRIGALADRSPLWLVLTCFALVVLTTVLVSPPGTAPFIYFQF
ncbi:MAG: MBOAT family protein [Pseudomonadota bacterium]